ncbi:hypothetical protein QJQ45_027140, partial [Haematococcus lacustris]
PPSGLEAAQAHNVADTAADNGTTVEGQAPLPTSTNPPPAAAAAGAGDGLPPSTTAAGNPAGQIMATGAAALTPLPLPSHRPVAPPPGSYPLAAPPGQLLPESVTQLLFALVHAHPHWQHMAALHQAQAQAAGAPLPRQPPFYPQLMPLSHSLPPPQPPQPLLPHQAAPTTGTSAYLHGHDRGHGSDMSHNSQPPDHADVTAPTTQDMGKARDQAGNVLHSSPGGGQASSPLDMKAAAGRAAGGAAAAGAGAGAGGQHTGAGEVADPTHLHQVLGASSRLPFTAPGGSTQPGLLGSLEGINSGMVQLGSGQLGRGWGSGPEGMSCSEPPLPPSFPSLVVMAGAPLPPSAMSSRSSGASTSYRQAALQKYLIKKKNRTFHKKGKPATGHDGSKARGRGSAAPSGTLAAAAAAAAYPSRLDPAVSSPLGAWGAGELGVGVGKRQRLQSPVQGGAQGKGRAAGQGLRSLASSRGARVHKAAHQGDGGVGGRRGVGLGRRGSSELSDQEEDEASEEGRSEEEAGGASG